MDAQQQIQSGLVDRAIGLISDQALMIAGLAAVGILVGIATTQAAKLAMRVFKGEPHNMLAKQQRALMYRLLGMGAGLLWTFALEWSVITGSGAFAVASAVAIIAGGFTPVAYDAFWNWVVPSLSRWFKKKAPGSDGDDDSGDETKTSFRPPK